MFKFPVITLSILTQAIKSVEREVLHIWWLKTKPQYNLVYCL